MENINTINYEYNNYSKPLSQFVFIVILAKGMARFSDKSTSKNRILNHYVLFI